jgi:5-methyltetrahydropteroyltriglutamate--homocysteine methyltransferase
MVSSRASTSCTDFSSRSPIELLGLLSGKDVMVGCIDVATERIETPEEAAAILEHALQYVPPERPNPCTNCGMVPMQRQTARGKLHALNAGAHLLRARLQANDRGA